MKNILLATTLVGAMTAHANAMTFATYTTSNGAQGARLSGELVHGDADRFAALIERNPNISVVSLESPGGFVNEGHKIARMVRDRGIHTRVASGVTCESACFEIFAAGTHRIVGTNAQVGVHRARFDREESAESQAYSIRYAAVIQGYGVPKSILASLLLQSSSSMYYLTPSDLNEMHVEWETVAKPAPATTPYSVVFKQPTTQPTTQVAEIPAPAPAQDPIDPTLEKMQQFDETYAKATSISSAQNRGRPATTRNCDRKGCEEILAFRDKHGQYVELHRSLITTSRYICRMTREGIFNDEYRCTNWLTGEAKIYRWSRDPLL